MEVFTDPITGKMFIKTKDGKIMEIITDPKTGKVYMRTASGNLKELPPGMELYVDPTTGKMYIGTKPKGKNLEVHMTNTSHYSISPLPLKIASEQ